MEAYKEIEKLIENSNYSDAKKAWLDMALFDMNQAKESSDKVMKEIVRDHSDDPNVTSMAMLNNFKDMLLTNLKDKVEAEESITIVKDIINKN